MQWAAGFPMGFPTAGILCYNKMDICELDFSIGPAFDWMMASEKNEGQPAECGCPCTANDDS